jgi:hypothetical protein
VTEKRQESGQVPFDGQAPDVGSEEVEEPDDGITS